MIARNGPEPDLPQARADILHRLVPALVHRRAPVVLCDGELGRAAGRLDRPLRKRAGRGDGPSVIRRNHQAQCGNWRAATRCAALVDLPLPFALRGLLSEHACRSMIVPHLDEPARRRMLGHDLGARGPRHGDVSPVWQAPGLGRLEYRRDLPSIGRVLRDAEGVRLTVDGELLEGRPGDVPSFAAILEPETQQSLDGYRQGTDTIGLAADLRQIASCRSRPSPLAMQVAASRTTRTASSYLRAYTSARPRRARMLMRSAAAAGRGDPARRAVVRDVRERRARSAASAAARQYGTPRSAPGRLALRW